MKIHPSTLSKFVNISTLKLAQAQIPKQFLQWLSKSTTLCCKHLDLHGAQIFSRSNHINSRHFTSLTTLNQWNYCNPVMEWLDISAVGLEYLSLNENCHLRWLFANDNFIISVHLYNLNLESLHLNNNRLRQWPLINENNIPIDYKKPTIYYKNNAQNLRKFQSLTTLILSNNSIKNLPSNWHEILPNIQNLDISANRIRSIKFEKDLTSLKFLNLSDNLIRNFHGISLTQLAILDLSANQLQHIDTQFFANYKSIQHLHLAKNPELLLENWLSDSDLNVVPEHTLLSTIDLSQCDIQIMPNFDKFKRLTQLNLNGNKLTKLNGKKLPNCAANIRIADNRIQEIGNITNKQLKCLRELDVSRNPLLCDCEIFSLRHVLKQQWNFYVKRLTFKKSFI